MMGPTSTPIVHNAITRPCCSGGYSCISETCASGTSAAPNRPCTMRNATISPRSVANPQATEPSVKPATLIVSTRRNPKREPSQPASGVAIAPTTMYDVSTQAIWSCVACRLPRMCGSATFTIVESIVNSSVHSTVARESISRRSACERNVT